MVQLSEIRKLRKKDEASVYIQISREIGLVLTWIILNVFPSVSANAVTISMLVINLVSIALLFKGILHNSLWLFISSFLLFNFSIFLDCVDGNIARFRQQQSVYGVFLDRLVHNVSYPLLFFVPGIAVLCKTSSFGWFLVFFLAGIMTELSPIQHALENTENLFVNQLLTGKKQTYSIEYYKLGSDINDNSSEYHSSSRKGMLVFRKIVELIPSWNRFYLVLFVDLVFPSTEFAITRTYIVLLILRLLVLQIRKVKHRIASIESKLKTYKK